MCHENWTESRFLDTVDRSVRISIESRDYLLPLCAGDVGGSSSAPDATTGQIVADSRPVAYAPSRSIGKRSLFTSPKAINRTFRRPVGGGRAIGRTEE